MKEYWTSLASLLGVLAFFQSILDVVLPPEIRYAVFKFFNRYFNWFSLYCYFDITEMDGVNTNQLYGCVQLYLGQAAFSNCNRLSLTRPYNSSATSFGLSNNNCILDTFRGVPVMWEHIVTQRQGNNFSWRPIPDEKRGFTLRMKKKDKALILDLYLDHIMDKAYEIRRTIEDRYIYTNSKGGSMDPMNPWESVPFKHPSTFNTLAMDPEKKDGIMEDLMDFKDGKEFYEKTGRAWKRGYLLYGPPGTGKSSMIAAMANFLGYDIYDLELSEVSNNSELRKLLMKTTARSIIVIEDIDCSVNLKNRKNDVSDMHVPPGMENGFGTPRENNVKSITLSGLLNFTDGLWSCCGSERIFVFTTNHVEKLDPALLRSGRMDMHIHMGNCCYPALKILLKNYLGYSEGELDELVSRKLEDVIDKAEMTPADISELLIKNRRNREKAVKELLAEFTARAGRDGKSGELGKRWSKYVEEEEHEKRALESQKI